MDGVIVLATEQAYSAFELMWLILGVCGLAVFGAIAIALLDESLPVSFILIALSGVCLIFCIRIPKTETRYEVMIEDSVSWNELSKRYDVIKIDGKIITLVEKEQNDGADESDP